MAILYKSDGKNPKQNDDSAGDDMPMISVDIPEKDKSYSEDDEESIDVEIDAEDDDVSDSHIVGHFENLAEKLSASVLSKLASDLIDDIEADKESMTEWRETLDRGLEIMGLKEIPTSALPFSGANTSSYPLLIEAVIQFNARAMKETLPSDGAVKCKIIGKASEEIEAAALRVEKHMNMQITFEDTGYFDNHDKTLMYLPYAGSAFKKTYRDTVKGVTVSRFIPAENILVNYHATCDEDLERITHVVNMSHQEYLRKVNSGDFCSKNKLSGVAGGTGLEDDLTVTTKEVEGREAVESSRDSNHIIYETYCWYDLPGFEHKDINGKPSGIALPYVVTIDKETAKVLSVRRNWEEDGNVFAKLDSITHYRYLSSFGYLGWGLLHIIGNLARGVNGLQRLSIDGAVMASFQGGFTAKTMKMKKGSYRLQPYEWIATDLDAEELNKAFYTPPFKNPDPMLINLANSMIEAGRRIGSTTETIVGDANNNAPVGTTIALIEQATKVMSGIHVRLHNSMAHEFMVRARINAQFLDNEALHFDADGDSGYIVAGDYKNPIKIIPVSDPNIVSQTQRIALAQGQLTLAQQFPQMHDMFEALKRMHKAMGTTDIDDLLIDPDKIPYLDPMAEGAYVVAGKPIRAFVTQDHAAHKAVHEGQMQFIQKNLNADQAEMLMMALKAHIAEHDAYFMYQVMGGDNQEFSLHAKEKDEASLEVDVERALSQYEAQNMKAFLQMLAQDDMAKEPSPEEAAQTEFAAEEARKQQAFIAEEARKQQAFDAEQARKNGIVRDETIANINAAADAQNEVRVNEMKMAEMDNQMQNLNEG